MPSNGSRPRASATAIVEGEGRLAGLRGRDERRPASRKAMPSMTGSSWVIPAKSSPQSTNSSSGPRPRRVLRGRHDRARATRRLTVRRRRARTARRFGRRRGVRRRPSRWPPATTIDPAATSSSERTTSTPNSRPGSSRSGTTMTWAPASICRRMSSTVFHALAPPAHVVAETPAAARASASFSPSTM